MSKPRNANPFFTEDDDDDSFARSKPRGVTGGSGASSNPWQSKKDPFLDDDDDFGYTPPKSRAEQLQEMKIASMKRQMASTDRSMQSLAESERIGIATAEELVHQGEQLDNVERNVDKINQDMKTSQRHLDSIKSVFGGIKNWWKGEKSQESAREPPPKEPTRLTATLEADRTTGAHPAMQHKSGNYGGFYSDNDGDQRQAQSSGQDDFRREYEAALDKNLDNMSAGLAQLKNLGLGLDDEITRQNQQIDKITDKTERTDTTLNNQNRQIRHILKK